MSPSETDEPKAQSLREIVKASIAEAQRQERPAKYSRQIAWRMAWASGVPELSLAFGVTLLFVWVALSESAIIGPAGSASGFITRLFMLVLVGATPYYLHRRLVAPWVASALALERTPAWLVSAVLTATLLAGSAAAWLTDFAEKGTPLFALLGVGFPLAVPAMIAFGYSGQQRHAFLGLVLAVTPIVFIQLPEGQALYSAAVPVLGLLIAGAWGLASLRRELSAPPTVSQLLDALASEDPLRRFGAAEFLAAVPEPRVVSALICHSEDADEIVRDEVRWALLRVWGPDADVRFEWHLEETGLSDDQIAALPDEEIQGILEDHGVAVENELAHWQDVRQALRNALHEEPELWDVLLRLAEEDLDEEGRLDAGTVAAFYLLVASNRPDGYEPVLRRAQAVPEPAWMYVVESFEHGDEETLEWLIQALGANTAVAVARAEVAMLQLLARLELAGYDPAGLSERLGGRVHELSLDAATGVREAAAFLLGLIRTEEAPTRLTAMLDDAEEPVREAALLGLSNIDRVAARDYVRTALEDVSMASRRVAVRAIWAMQWETGAKLVDARRHAWIDELSDAREEEVDELAELIDEADELVEESRRWAPQE